MSLAHIQYRDIRHEEQYHVSWNGGSNAANARSSDNPPNNDLSNGISRSLEKGANADQKTTEKDSALPANLHTERTDTERHDAGSEVVD